MDYQITATLGPSSGEAPLWEGMLETGVSAFRLNTSHLTLDELENWLERLIPVVSTQAIPLVLDLQGSKWRLGQFPPFTLQAGETVELTLGDATGKSRTLPVPHPDFFQAADEADGTLLLNDAKSALQTIDVSDESIRTTVKQGGLITPNKGITWAHSSFRKENLHPKDQAIVERVASTPSIQFAISYVKDAAEMQRYREWIGREAYLIAKLERPSALEQVEAIAEWVDELWLCRGDLGAEVGLQDMARAVHDFSSQARLLEKPTFMAGQVLEHMTHHPTPTRSEICYLHDALTNGFNGVVLSDETAIGEYPLDSCRAAAMFR